MPVSVIIIPRLNAIFPPEMKEELGREYIKVLKSFSDRVLTEGMDRLAAEYDGRFRPTPAVVRRFCIDVERKSMAALPTIRDRMKDARELVKAKKTQLESHGAYRCLREGHRRARVHLERLIYERALIQAQALCGRADTAYDATIAFGYGTWGPKTSAVKFRKAVWVEIAQMRDLALRSKMLEVEVPQKAIDWFNDLAELEGAG